MEAVPDTELVVATPERVSFDYQIAGIGTRAIAQILDLLIISGILILLSFFALGFAVAQAETIANLILIIGGFVVVFGYFWACEAFWSGQTVGKRVFRLRVVGDRGEPLTFAQAAIRNVVRIVDFLPYGYGVGIVALFINGKGKRLGDLVAGTVVVKDSDYLPLWQLPGGIPRPGERPYWAAPTPQPAVVTLPATPAEVFLRQLDPDLRRFVTTYGRRRPELPLELRAQLAARIQANLKSAVPDIFGSSGPLAALDYLANLERQ
jgi:uncharacterized RDD family membrane protein YckC